jgi:hypothetical protein
MKTEIKKAAFPMHAMTTNNSIAPVLFIDMNAGHAAIHEEAEERLFILSSIVSVLSVAHVESLKKTELSNLFHSLSILIGEANDLSSASYHMACGACAPRERAE